MGTRNTQASWFPKRLPVVACWSRSAATVSCDCGHNQATPILTRLVADPVLRLGTRNTKASWFPKKLPVVTSVIAGVATGTVKSSEQTPCLKSI